MSTRIRFKVLALAVLLLARNAFAGDCSRWLPDIDPDCERVARPEGFAGPVASPFLFEDAFVTTGVQGYFMRQSVRKDSVLSGGEIEVAAGQFHIAITDRVGIVAGKVGMMWIQPDNIVIPRQATWLPLTLGIKLGVYQDPEAARFAAAVLRYGDGLQGCGNGSLLPSVVGAMRAGDFALQGDLGGSASLDSAFSSSVFWHAHVGFARWRYVTPFMQLSGQHWVRGGDGSKTVALSGRGRQYLGTSSLSVRTAERMFGTFEGADLFNIGAHDIAGRSLVTGSLGIEVRVGPVAISSAYEIPVISEEGLLENRLTARISFEL